MAWSEALGRRLKLHDLRLLVAVAQAGSMGRAALLLNTSQPAMSRRIADLEAMLGVTLFERTPRGIAPTPQGRALVETAIGVFDSLRRGIDQMESLADPGAGELRVGGHESIIAGIMPAISGQLRARFPRLIVHVVPLAGEGQQVTALRDRRLDLVLGRVAPPFEPDVAGEVLYQEHTCVVAAANHPLARRRRRVAFEDLLGEPWALPAPGTLVAALFEDAFRSSGLAYPPACAVTGHIHLHLALAAHGGFLAILPQSVLRLGGDGLGLRVLPVTSPVPPAPVGILRLRDRALTPAAAAFVASAREVTGVLARPGD